MFMSRSRGRFTRLSLPSTVSNMPTMLVSVCRPSRSRPLTRKVQTPSRRLLSAWSGATPSMPLSEPPSSPVPSVS